MDGRNSSQQQAFIDPNPLQLWSRISTIPFILVVKIQLEADHFLHVSHVWITVTLVKDLKNSVLLFVYKKVGHRIQYYPSSQERIQSCNCYVHGWSSYIKRTWLKLWLWNNLISSICKKLRVHLDHTNYATVLTSVRVNNFWFLLIYVSQKTVLVLGWCAVKKS